MAQKFILLGIAVAIFATLTRVQVTTATEDILQDSDVPDASNTTPTVTPATTTTETPGTTTTETPGTTTTVAPSTTTTDGPGTTTTVAPGTTTTDGPGTTTTAAPGTTTTDGPGTTTTAAPGSTTTDGPGTTTTVAPGTTTPSTDPCNPNPCGSGSTCSPRANQTFVCYCMPGEAYNNKTTSCEKAKVFPGKVQLSKVPFEESMRDPKSPKFKETADKITAELDDVFEKNPTYTGSKVLALLPSTNRVMLRAGEGVTASVEINFSPNSEIKSDDVLNEIKDYPCTDCFLDGGTFEETTLCSLDPCDVQSTECKSGDGSYSCPCLDGYIQTDYSTRLCVLACPYGEELKGDKCVKCAFGYSGLNCSENWKLILVIVGSVLGGLLLIALILLPVVATLTSKKSPKKKNKNADVEKPNQASVILPLATGGYRNNQAGPFSGAANGQAGYSNNEMSKLPRAAASSWDSRPKLETSHTNNQHSFGHPDRSSRIYDDPYDVNPYPRPQNGVNRPRTTNPYAQSQGHSNPYYRHDDGKSFY